MKTEGEQRNFEEVIQDTQSHYGSEDRDVVGDQCPRVQMPQIPDLDLATRLQMGQLNLEELKKYYSILKITTVSKKDINKLGDKTLGVDNSKLREQVK